MVIDRGARVRMKYGIMAQYRKRVRLWDLFWFFRRRDVVKK